MVESHKKLSVFFTAGYPTLNDTATILQRLDELKVRTVEIGFPFSDPMADGPTIQHSGNVALKNGMTLEVLFKQLQEVPRPTHSSWYLMGYLNPVIQYGVERFLESAASSSVSGFIIPDLPLHEYRSEFKILSQKRGLKPVFLVTDRTSDERVCEFDGEEPAFLYVVAVDGVTGNAQARAERLQEVFSRLRSLRLKSELVAGFGISTPSVFAAMSHLCDRAIVGSEFIRRISNVPALDSTRSTPEQLQATIDQFVEQFSQGVDS